MKPTRRMNGDWGHYPELEEVAERGSVSAVTSGLLLAGLILTFTASNLFVCILDRPRGLELHGQVDRVKVDHVSAAYQPRSPRSVNQEPRRNG